MPPGKVMRPNQALEIPVDSPSESVGVARQGTDLALSSAPLPSVHVSNANLTELKGALDEAVKRVSILRLMRP